jgi:hypothetical protein
MARTYAVRAGSLNDLRQRIVEGVLKLRFYYALIATIALLLVTGVQATADNPPMFGGHGYVNYTVNHVPTAQGALVDVTSQLTMDQDGHVFDLYGNQLVFSSTDSYIRDVNSQVVGFVYVAAP